MRIFVEYDGKKYLVTEREEERLSFQSLTEEPFAVKFFWNDRIQVVNPENEGFGNKLYRASLTTCGEYAVWASDEIDAIEELAEFGRMSGFAGWFHSEEYLAELEAEGDEIYDETVLQTDAGPVSRQEANAKEVPA